MARFLVVPSSCRPVVLGGSRPLEAPREDDKTTRRQDDGSRVSPGFAGGSRARQADLRQPPRPRHGKPPRISWKGRISPKAIHPYLQYALRKLEILYYLAKRQHGVKGEPRPERPAGVSDKIEAIPLDEAELGRRLHRIYRELNYAWAIRKPGRDRGGKLPTRATIRRKDRFPRVFPF